VSPDPSLCRQLNYWLRMVVLRVISHNFSHRPVDLFRPGDVTLDIASRGSNQNILSLQWEAFGLMVLVFVISWHLPY
jgi:hypothetical protein